jgi:hypothetical protein
MAIGVFVQLILLLSDRFGSPRSYAKGPSFQESLGLRVGERSSSYGRKDCVYLFRCVDCSQHRFSLSLQNAGANSIPARLLRILRPKDHQSLVVFSESSHPTAMSMNRRPRRISGIRRDRGSKNSRNIMTLAPRLFPTMFRWLVGGGYVMPVQL